MPCPAACPSEVDFLERVRSRVQRARFAEPGELAHTFEVTIGSADGDGAFLGRVEFVDSDGQRVARSLKGSACDELASGLALITALALDDRIAEAPPDDVSPKPSPPPAEPKAGPGPEALEADALPDFARIGAEAPAADDFSGLGLALNFGPEPGIAEPAE